MIGGSYIDRRRPLRVRVLSSRSLKTVARNRTLFLFLVVCLAFFCIPESSDF